MCSRINMIDNIYLAKRETIMYLSGRYGQKLPGTMRLKNLSMAFSASLLCPATTTTSAAQYMH